MIERILAGIAEHQRKFLLMSILFYRPGETLRVDCLGPETEQSQRLKAALGQGWKPAGFVAVTDSLKAVVWPIEKGNQEAESALDEARRNTEIEMFNTTPEALEILLRMDVHINSGVFMFLMLVIAGTDNPLLVPGSKTREERLKITNDALQAGGVPLGFIGIEARPDENGQPKFHIWPLGNFRTNQDVWTVLESLKSAALKELEKLSS